MGIPRALRVSAVLALAAAALAFPGAAAAALTSAKLLVGGASHALGGTGGVRISFQAAQTDADVAKLTFFVPNGYELTVGQPPGTRVATAVATVFARDLNQIVRLSGAVEAASGSEFAAEAIACTGTADHAATWALRLQAGSTPLTLPAFLDPAVAPVTQFAATTIVLCFPPSEIPVGSAGRAPLGAKVVTIEVATAAMVNPLAAGAYRWRATATAYAAGSGEPDAESTVEVQSLVELPAQLSLQAKATRSGKRGTSTITYTGLVRSNRVGVADAAIDVLKGATATAARKFRTQTTDENGVFAGTLAHKQVARPTSVFLQAKATAADKDLGPSACTATFFPPVSTSSIPCLGATVAGFSITSVLRRVVVPAAPRPKAKKR